MISSLMLHWALLSLYFLESVGRCYSLAPHSRCNLLWYYIFEKLFLLRSQRSYAFFHREQKSFSVWASLHLGDLQFDSKDRKIKDESRKIDPPIFKTFYIDQNPVSTTQTGHKVRFFFFFFLAVTCVLTDSNLCQHCTLTLNMGQKQQHFRD